MSLPSILKAPRIDPATNKPIRDSRTGKQLTYTYINPVKRYVKPYWPVTHPRVVNLGANAISQTIPVRFEEGMGHMELFYLMYQSTGPFTIYIYDDTRQHYWSNRELHIDTIAGTGQYPLIFPESYFMNVAGGARQLSLIFRDLSGAPNAIRVGFGARRWLWKEAPREVFKEMEKYFATKERASLYFLTTENPINAFTTAAQVTEEFRMTSDAYFEVFKATQAVIDTVAAAPANFEVQFIEHASSRRFHQDPEWVHHSFIFGGTNIFAMPVTPDGLRPYIYSESLLMERDTRLIINLNQLAALPTSHDVYLTLIGRKMPFPEEIVH